MLLLGSPVVLPLELHRIHLLHERNLVKGSSMWIDTQGGYDTLSVPAISAMGKASSSIGYYYEAYTVTAMVTVGP